MPSLLECPGSSSRVTVISDLSTVLSKGTQEMLLSRVRHPPSLSSNIRTCAGHHTSGEQTLIPQQRTAEYLILRGEGDTVLGF